MAQWSKRLLRPVQDLAGCLAVQAVQSCLVRLCIRVLRGKTANNDNAETLVFLICRVEKTQHARANKECEPVSSWEKPQTNPVLSTRHTETCNEYLKLHRVLIILNILHFFLINTIFGKY